ARFPRAALRALLVVTLLRLDALPEALDRLRRQPLRVAEHVRMAAQKLVDQRPHHVVEVENALLLRHAGMEHDLEQEVAELLAQIGEITARDGVGDLVGFLDRIGSNRREVLREVPRTAGAWRA